MLPKILKIIAEVQLRKIFQGFFIIYLLSFSLNIYAPIIEAKSTLKSKVESKTQSISLLPRKVKIDISEKYQSIIHEVLTKIPAYHISSLTKIIEDQDPEASRGLASFKSIYLGTNNIFDLEEFKRVFIHEIGHVVDLGALKETEKKQDSGFRDGINIIYETDPSLIFYQLCWITETSRNQNCDDLDFVSGYAQTDVFEDFAESYLLFLENNLSFQEMAKNSEIIKKKYDFLANVVFKNDFLITEEIDLPWQKRVWDLTKVGIL